jgi:hypothetical protein
LIWRNRGKKELAQNRAGPQTAQREHLHSRAACSRIPKQKN